MNGTEPSPRALLGERAPWLLAPELAVCAVGSAALAEACRRAGCRGPAVRDLDLAWALDVGAGEALLRAHDVFVPTTAGNVGRGTLALKLGALRIEITSFRGQQPSAPLEQQIVADLRRRDMTAGALAWWLAPDRILDPCGGLADWNARRVVAVGAAAERIAEHPVRWLRYYRRACEWQFGLDRGIASLRADVALLQQISPEALAGEVRAALLHCASPGSWLADLASAGLLAPLLPELALQFDGRPAGPTRHHPEGSQGEHLRLCLEWLRRYASGLPPGRYVATAVAVLCHDLGKGLTAESKLPRHVGHENSGLALIDALLARLPGLSDAASRRLAHAVCRLHLLAGKLRGLRPGTLARLYDEVFRPADFPVREFSLAVGADAGGRGGADPAAAMRLADTVTTDLEWLRTTCGAVDAAALRLRHADTEAFRSALHQARAAAIASTRRQV